MFWLLLIPLLAKPAKFRKPDRHAARFKARGHEPIRAKIYGCAPAPVGCYTYYNSDDAKKTCHLVC